MAVSIAYTTNQGAQAMSFVYQESAQAKLFNRLLTSLFPVGVYSGFTLTRLDSTHVQVSIGVALIGDANNTTDSSGNALNITVRAEFTATQSINLDDGTDTGYCNSAKPYLVLRFGWNDQANNYANIVAVAYSNDPTNTDVTKILPTDVILGKVLMTATSGHYAISTSSSFDLTRRTVAFLPDGQASSVELTVASSEVNVKKVYVNSGSINTSLGRKTVSGGNYPLAIEISDTVAGRYDLVWVDSSGIVQITEGIDSASPVAPPYGTKKVIGEIRRGAGRTSIVGPEIYNVDVTRQGEISASDINIADVGNYFTAYMYSSGYSVKTVEAALQQLASAAASLLSSFNAHVALDVSAGATAHGLNVVDVIS
jgi:hypothetical protein